MKFHLPKKLLVAVLATLSVQTTLAGYYTIGGVIGVDTDGKPITGVLDPESIPEASGTVVNAPIAKDGSGTLTIDKEADRQQDLFIREGQLIIKSHFTLKHFQTDTLPDKHYTVGHPSGDPKLDGPTHLAIAGKDAELIVDGKGGSKKTIASSTPVANVSEQYTASCVLDAQTYGSHVTIGGVDGNGKLIIQNNAYFTNKGGWSTHIGYSGELDETNYKALGCHVQHATTATTSGEYTNIADRYIGNYTPGSVDSSKYFGKGEVYVRNNSYIHFGGSGMSWAHQDTNSGGIYMGEAILSIEESSTGEAGDSYFGTHSGALSEIKIAKDSELNLTRNLSTGYEKNGIIVEDAKIVIDVDDESTLSVANQANLSANDNNTTTTVLSLTNNSKAKFGSLTAGSESGNSTAEINIDATSSVEAYTKDLQVTINHADVNNAGAIKAKKIDINNGGTLSMIGKDAKLNDNSEVTVNAGGTLQADGGEPIALNAEKVTVEEGGAISLKNGSTLSAKALTMAAGSKIRLSGNYSSGDKLVSSDNLDVNGVTVTMDNGQIEYTIENGVVYLTAVFDNSIAEALTVTNWGIATASRTFVNAVRGQRTNTGCIANGRGTAWAAVLGATSDIGSGDVDLKGAAVGADMKVGEKSSLGVAFGYIDGDAKIPGMSKAEQEGTYVALYGEHGLRKLSATCCLSLDWVAAYGQTDTEWESADWEQQSLQLNTRLNWNKKVTDRLCMSVFGGLEYFTSESDRVENAKTGSIQNLRGEIGVGARYVAWGTPGSEAVTDEKGATIAAARPGCEKLVLHGEIRYMNDMVRSNPVIEQDGIRDGGDNPGRQGMGIEAGATYRISERWSASANYGFNTMEDSKEHRVNVGASYTF